MQTEFVAWMEGIPLFQGVSREGLRSLAARARLRTFRSGEAILGETDPVRAFFVVIDGRVKLYKSSSEGKEQTLCLLGVGEPFGLCTAFATPAFPANVSALEDSAVVVIPGPELEAAARQEPVLLLNVIRILSRRLKESMALVESLSLYEIPQRLSAFLLQSPNGRRKGAPGLVRLATTHRELAKILGATPEALSRALKKMTADGILRVEGRDISILDRAGLEAVAAGE